VWHYPDANNFSPADSTSNAIAGTNHSVAAAAGKIGGAGVYDGSTRYVDYGQPAAISINNNLTVSFWVKTTAAATQDFFGGRWHYPDSGLLLGMNSNGKLRQYFSNGVRQANSDGALGSVINNGAWRQITYTWSGGRGTFYVDGVVDSTFDGSASVTSLGFSASYNFYFGRDSGTAGEYWNGSIDEVRVSNIVRSAAWITTDYNNQNAPGTFLTLGPVQLRTSSATH